jgi:hypothetical protein
MRSYYRHFHSPVAVVAARILGLALVLVAPPAAAAWSNDPAVNLAIGDGAGEQVVPKIAGGPDGSCYVGWFDNRSGNYDVRLQRLDSAGNELWGHNGILVSSHPQDTWISDWDLICDAEGSCVLTFSDIRSGNWDVQAYKITGDGVFAWGADGINISQSAAWEPSPAVCQAGDGDCVFAWAQYPDAGGGCVMMQRLAPDGTLRYAVGGISVVSVGTEEPGFPDLEPSLGGDVLLMWVRDISTYMSPRQIRLQRFTAAGTAVWATFTAIFDGPSIPMGYGPNIGVDGAGGAVCGWHRASGNLFGSFVQRVSATGVEAFAHNGVAVTTDATRNHLDPAIAFNTSTGEFFAFWNERNYDQNQWGIYAQRISSAGVRLWANTGIVVQPVNSVYKSYPRAVPVGDGAACFFTDTPAGFSGDRLISYRLNATGANVWPTVPLPVSTAQSGKSRLPLFIDGMGTTRIIWEDTRNGTPDVYAQSVNVDGTLGGDPAGVTALTPTSLTATGAPNPFHGATEFALPRIGPAPDGLAIAAADGRLVRQVSLRSDARDRSSWRWDGRDDAGRELPAGVYLFRWTNQGVPGAAGRAVLVR